MNSYLEYLSTDLLVNINKFLPSQNSYKMIMETKKETKFLLIKNIFNKIILWAIIPDKLKIKMLYPQANIQEIWAEKWDRLFKIYKNPFPYYDNPINHEIYQIIDEYKNSIVLDYQELDKFLTDLKKFQ